MTPEVLAALTGARAAKRPVVLATRLPTGEQLLLPDAAAPAALAEAARIALRDDRTGTVTLADGEWFLRAYNPPLRLVVVGAVHIAQALVPMAAQLGLAVVVVDPRRAFASRFPLLPAIPSSMVCQAATRARCLIRPSLPSPCCSTS